MTPEDLQQLVPPFLGRQRWFAGEEPAPGQVKVQDFEVLQEDWPRLVWALVDVSGAHYQILAGGRPLGEPAEFLGGHENGVIGEFEGAFWYDASYDPALAMVFLDIVTDGSEKAERVRPMGVEQSNTSLVYDERIIAKLFRRLQPGRNPDVEVTTALAGEGFTHVAEPLATWQRDGYDLALVQEFLVGGSEGWALALTSLRDLYAEGPDDPAEAGGDFGGEAERLGQVTAEMHLALAEAFGTSAGDGKAWAASMSPAVDSLESDDERAGARRVFERLAAVADAGPAVRVHGDYHLGQVMRTDSGWFVLDFEGEPARSLEERQAPASPMKDVTGMLRSIDYAARSALAERESNELERLEPLANAWRDRNRAAFLRGYLDTPEIDRLLPSDQASYDAVLAAFELDKAIYELKYEQAYRPDWVEIPRSAIRRLTFG